MKIAVVGGGQLGRMMGLAGIPLGIDFVFCDPAANACAGAAGPVHVGPLDDPASVAAIADGADAITYEWEGVPASTLEPFVHSHFVAPSLRALATSQDRVAEKQLANELGLGTAPWIAVDDRAGLTTAIERVGTPAVLKTRSGGYDGKGQHRILSIDDGDAAWTALGPAGSLVLEGFVAFDRELSVIACRGRDGATVVWPITENHHEHGILRESRVLDDARTQARATAIVTTLLDELDYVGTLCIELFEVAGELLVNEFAPRVHNSGHWSIDGAETSQFENHVRAMLGWPLGRTDPLGAVAMLNCIGALPEPSAALAIGGAHLHDYGKSPRPGRKVGHLTLVAPDENTLQERLVAAREVIAAPAR